MPYQHIEQSVQLKYRSYLAVEDGTRLRARLSLYVDSLIIELTLVKSLHRILPVTAGYGVAFPKSAWKASSVDAKLPTIRASA